MNKTIILLISMLASVTIFGMQHHHQQQHQQQTQEQKKDKKKHRWYSNDKENTSEQFQSKEDDDLDSDMSEIIKAIETQDGSVDNYFKNTQKKKRIELCPICSDPNCPQSKEIYE